MAKKNNTIFDDVYKTELKYLRKLIIPLINEVFHTGYTEDVEIEYHSEEYSMPDEKRIIDSKLRIGDKLYHIECQSSPDSQMVIRMIEYDFAIALRNAEQTGIGQYTMEFPKSCVLYLRHTKKTPDTLTVQIRFAGGETVRYECPVVKVQNYTKDEIFEKNLLLLLPYYLMRYEREMNKIGKLEDIEEADNRMDVILAEYADICNRLYEELSDKDGAYIYSTLTEQIKRIAEYLAPENERERVIDMGGKVIKPEAQVILEQGISQGLSQGISQGARQLREAVELLRSGGNIEELRQKGFSDEIINNAVALK